MCLGPKVDNGNNITWPLVSVGCASRTNIKGLLFPCYIKQIEYFIVICYITLNDSDTSYLQFDLTCNRKKLLIYIHIQFIQLKEADTHSVLLKE